MKTSTHSFNTEIAKRIQEQPNAFVFAAFSAPVQKESEIKRIRMRPLLLKGTLHFQISSFTQTQCFSVNVLPNELSNELFKAMSSFTQILLHFIQDEIHGHIEAEKVTYKTTAHKKVYLQDFSHNRLKNYQLPEKEPSEFLIGLGIQSKEGRVIRDKFDKFKQINRFLELVNDIRSELSEIPNIVDFGCGKAYLTFALYSMFEEASIVGVDARKDVIDKCIALKESLGATNLQFKQMRIEQYKQNTPVDLVLALHACDTATDAAIAKGIELKSQVILVAPCCQHEVASQIKKDSAPLLIQHGLLKERYSALVTDALRAEILNQLGYAVDVVEFIDPDHTPKNLLIRAVKKPTQKTPDWSAYKELKNTLGVTLTLENILQIHP